jgi:hypothetical protein
MCGGRVALLGIFILLHLGSWCSSWTALRETPEVSRAETSPHGGRPALLINLPQLSPVEPWWIAPQTPTCTCCCMITCMQQKGGAGRVDEGGKERSTKGCSVQSGPVGGFRAAFEDPTGPGFPDLSPSCPSPADREIAFDAQDFFECSNLSFSSPNPSLGSRTLSLSLGSPDESLDSPSQSLRCAF